MNDRTLSPLPKRRRITVDLRDLIEPGIFALIVVIVYVLTGLALRWAGVA